MAIRSRYRGEHNATDHLKMITDKTVHRTLIFQIISRVWKVGAEFPGLLKIPGPGMGSFPSPLHVRRPRRNPCDSSGRPKSRTGPSAVFPPLTRPINSSWVSQKGTGRPALSSRPRNRVSSRSSRFRAATSPSDSCERSCSVFAFKGRATKKRRIRKLGKSVTYGSTRHRRGGPGLGGPLGRMMRARGDSINVAAQWRDGGEQTKACGLDPTALFTAGVTGRVN